MWICLIAVAPLSLLYLLTCISGSVISPVGVPAAFGKHPLQRSRNHFWRASCSLFSFVLGLSGKALLSYATSHHTSTAHPRNQRASWLRGLDSQLPLSRPPLAASSAVCLSVLSLCYLLSALRWSEQLVIHNVPPPKYQSPTTKHLTPPHPTTSHPTAPTIARSFGRSVDTQPAMYLFSLAPNLAPACNLPLLPWLCRCCCRRVGGRDRRTDGREGLCASSGTFLDWRWGGLGWLAGWLAGGRIESEWNLEHVRHVPPRCCKRATASLSRDFCGTVSDLTLPGLDTGLTTVVDYCDFCCMELCWLTTGRGCRRSGG
ncbi:hypothetical protein BJ546DRAFT_154970 [Cryomyces antarcticus]